MYLDIITLFPEIFSIVNNMGVIGRSCKNNICNIHTWNPRDFSDSKRKNIDDRPYGGGPGMVMTPIPLENTLNAINKKRNLNGLHSSPVILLTPIGSVFTQKNAEKLSTTDGFVIICGRYEGIDKRFIDRFVTDEISIGDFIISGGEIAALALIDSVIRLLPGTLNNKDSILYESFSDANDGLLEPYSYTRPYDYNGEYVPDVLINGDHQKINIWRRQKALEITMLRRPDLIEKARHNGLLSCDDEKVILNFLLKKGL
ncbi:tRNA (guanosine(37)-N1)-methyltransferase TrmD [Candidatus Kinetoplastidibacterium crithidiae]|uniref:tRNA (guanine-N(1)-)-methyltransferase n=1 Tax=Candidatus Kinetoplastidibacterium crithidiae TCC036E TaxID=1208918 RepID=M1LPW2_9PROT|nr:tRNA (guanosine(37)-N1)-methyltransferase TrmD [Candidatus Kinetoplastibacterium crithidii]AFZ82657.1 methyltransferase [Candidatus Kinetoplastibacterium crithidii (ex Angomonas deanei ATCC 30255)]AGF47682.1 tRNA (guanine-N1-)-methyltransferase [Candidatus Kinetoplastibacterium crithidii TCC036E]